MHTQQHLIRPAYLTYPAPFLFLLPHAQGLSCGSNDYICKPFRKLELLARIDTQLRLRRAWQVEIEREKSEVLLRRMLPHHIIQRLSEPGHNGVIADQHEHVAVLFADIVGFTAMSARLPTIEIIEMLNEARNFNSYTLTLTLY